MRILKSHNGPRYVFCILSAFFALYGYSQCPPTQSVTISLDVNRQAHTQALDFFLDSSAEQIITAVNRDVYDCQNIGIQEITLSIINEQDNPNVCKEFIVVTDPSGFCNGTPQLPTAILGKIVTPDGYPVQGVTVGIAAERANVFRGTNEDGLYRFEDIAEDAYTLEPSKNNDFRNGVSTRDIIVLQKHLIRMNVFDTPYQYFAADINNNGEVTAHDMILLRQLILGIIDEFPDNTSWRFMRSDYEFEDPNAPLQKSLSTAYQITYEPSLSLNNNFIGIKVGDLNNTVYANANMQSRSNEQVILSIKDKAFERDDIIELDFKPLQDLRIEGFQLDLPLDNSAFSIINIDGLRQEEYSFNNGHLLISKVDAHGIEWEEGTPVFTIALKAKKSGRASDFIKNTKEILENELYIKEATLPLKLSFESSITEVIVQNNFPNPFSTITYLPVKLPEASWVSINIYSIDGRRIWQNQQFLEAGHFDWPISANFSSDGIYLYELIVRDKVYTGKLNYREAF